MERELQILLEEIQREHDYLEKEMNSCIKDWDFKGAEAFRKSLIHTKEKLAILQNLENPNFDLINNLKRQIQICINFEDEGKMSKFAAERLSVKIQELQIKLKELEESKPSSQVDSDELITCLEKMKSGTLNCFEIIIKEGRVNIRIEKNNRAIVIHINKLNEKPINSYITEFGIIELKKIGFTIENSKAIMKIEEFGSSRILDTLEIISRIVYDVFRDYGNKKAEIKY